MSTEQSTIKGRLAELEGQLELERQEAERLLIKQREVRTLSLRLLGFDCSTHECSSSAHRVLIECSSSTHTHRRIPLQEFEQKLASLRLADQGGGEGSDDSLAALFMGSTGVLTERSDALAASHSALLCTLHPVTFLCVGSDTVLRRRGTSG
jgi:hypothetical protein